MACLEVALHLGRLGAEGSAAMQRSLRRAGVSGSTSSTTCGELWRNAQGAHRAARTLGVAPRPPVSAAAGPECAGVRTSPLRCYAPCRSIDLVEYEACPSAIDEKEDLPAEGRL